MRRYLLIRLFRSKRKARYWKKYALKLEAQLEGERWRNLDRKDVIDTSWIRALGLFAPEPRSAPAPPQIPLRRQIRPPQTTESAWSKLTADERVEYDMWKEDAPAHLSEAKLRSDFLEMLSFRKSQEM